MTRFNLPDVEFAAKSAQQIETDIVKRFEQITGIGLSAADPRRLFLQTIVPMIAQQRVLIDHAAKQNLLGYSSGAVLDQIGAMNGVTRLPAVAARTTVRFHLSIPQNQTVPIGTRVTAGGGVFFATVRDLLIPAEAMQAEVEAICTESGLKGNGFLPGQLNQLVDPSPFVARVENVTTSEGGADEESDDAFADRIRQSPERFSAAGPTDGYIYWARTASPLIADVSVTSPAPGVVEIRPLLQNGELPDQELLVLVDVVCNDRKVRPLTDNVQVLAPEAVPYTLELTYWIGKSNSTIAASIQSAVQKAVDGYVTWQALKLGRDIDPSELIARVKAAGAKRVAVTSPVYAPVAPHQVAIVTTTDVTYGGLEDD